MPYELTRGDASMPVTCYVASSGQPGARIIADQVAAALEDLNVTVMGLGLESDYTLLPEPWSQADFAVVVLTSMPQPELAFELGALTGSRTPILLIASRELNLPLSLAELPKLIWRAEKEGLNFQLESFIRSRVRKRRAPRAASAAQGRRASGVSRPPSHAGPPPAAAWIAYSHGTSMGKEVAAALSAAPFKTAPLEPLITQRESGVFADVALWLPELEPLNPIILEAKDTDRPGSGAWSQLTNLLSVADLHLGLLVSRQKLDAPQVQIRDDVAVVHVSLNMLANLSRKGPLRTSLLRARNQLVHQTGQ